jgi:hypothetical protein
MVNQRREEVKKLMNNGQNAAQISRTLRLPYSTTAEIVRELKNSAN